MDYMQRESQKSKAWPVISDPNTSLDEKANALIRIIEAHYWRAMDDIDGMSTSARIVMGLSNLRFDTYASHWLHANGERFPKELIAEVCEILQCKPSESPYLPKGASQYVARRSKG